MPDAPAPTRAEEAREDCAHCGAKLTAEEREFYGVACERCETELHMAMQDDRDPVLPPPVSEVEHLRARAARAEAEVARLRAEVERVERERDEARDRATELHNDNQRLRWRHPAVLPEWNDLPDGMRVKLAKTAEYYDPDWGATMVVNLYATLRQDMMEMPHVD